MNIEIYNNKEKVDIENLVLTNFKEKLENDRKILSSTEINFKSISSLKGDKKILNIAFLNELAELLKL